MDPTQVKAAEVKAEIDRYARWHYEFELVGVKTPIFVKSHVNRHEQRCSYFFDTLVRVAGGTLKGKRVLDLGCNAGFWSLKAIEAGCDFVYGVDGRQMHIDQANLVFRAKGIDPARYQFSVGNILDSDLSIHGPYEVALCLGVLYHVNKPVELFERIAAVNTDIMVIDTAVSSISGSYLEIRHEVLDNPRNAFDYELVMNPTRQAVIDIAQQFGYRSVPLALNISDFEAMVDYLPGERLAFVCAKTSSLADVPAGRVAPPFSSLERVSRSALRLTRAAAFTAKHLLRRGVRGRRQSITELLHQVRHGSPGGD